MQVSFTAAEILAIAQPRETRGSTTEVIHHVAALSLATAGDLSFLGNTKYKSEVAESRASIILLPKDYVGDPTANQLFVLVDKPSLVLSRICARMEQLLWPKPQPGIHSTAVVDHTAKIAASATVGPFCIIESGA